MAYVRVDLLDVNDNRPSFYPLQYAVSLSTQSAPGTSVVKVTAYDPDAGVNGRVTYRTVPGGGSPFFTLNKDTGGWPRPACERVRAVLTAPAVEKNSLFSLWSHLNNYSAGSPVCGDSDSECTRSAKDIRVAALLFPVQMKDGYYSNPPNQCLSLKA